MQTPAEEERKFKDHTAIVDTALKKAETVKCEFQEAVSNLDEMANSVFNRDHMMLKCKQG